VLSNYHEGQDGHLTILDNTREIIATPEANMADRMKHIEEVDAGLAAVLAQINTDANAIRYVSDDVDRLYFQQKLTMADWYVSFRIDESVVLAEANRNLLISAAISLAILIFSLVFMLILLRMLFKPIIELRDRIHDLSDGDADLTKRIDVKTKDELGEIANDMNIFIGNLQTIVQEVKVASEDVASGNSELAATMEELSTTFGHQAEQVSHVATSMTEMSNTSQGIVSTVKGSIDAMEEAEGFVARSNTELQHVMHTMDAVKGQTAQLSNTVHQLTESSVKISEILTVISSIADQTNLLALNAAIEAARAGDAGRGFAVVADEVRKLAESTQSSTNEITAIINTLHKDTSNASIEMSNTVNSVNASMEGITEASEHMNQIVEASDNVQLQLEGVNGEVNHQFDTMGGISDDTRDIAAGVEESVHAIGEVTSTVAHLQVEADALKAIVARFKI
jgi:methyl-accepting chemotaxis protein